VTSEQFNNKEYKQVIIDSSEKFPRPFNNHIRIERFQPFLFGSLFQVVDSTPKFVVTQISYSLFHNFVPNKRTFAQEIANTKWKKSNPNSKSAIMKKDN
jgi:hypothetical protein